MQCNDYIYISLTNLFPAMVMFLGEVELHVCDIPEPGRGGLGIRQVQRGRLVLERDVPVQARFHHCLSAETRDVLWWCSECDPLRWVEGAWEDTGDVGLRLFCARHMDIIIVNSIRNEVEQVAQCPIDVASTEVVKTPVTLDCGDR